MVDAGEKPPHHVVEGLREGELMAEVEGGEVGVKKVEAPRVPVIRVRLDDHFADVTVEDLVRCLFPPLLLPPPPPLLSHLSLGHCTQFARFEY